MLLNELRNQIDAIDSELVTLLGKRTEIAREIGRIKKRERLPILDSNREKAIKEKLKLLAKEQKISAAVMDEIIQIVLDYTRLEMEAV